MLLRVPDGFGLALRVVLDLVPGARGDRVDDLAVSEGIAVPAQVRGQVDGRLGHPRADDEPQIGVVELSLGVRRTEMLHDPLTPTGVLRDLYRRRT